MKFVQAAHDDLPEELRIRVLELVEEMYQAVVGGELSAAAAEERVAELSRGLGGEVLSSALSEAYGGQTGPSRQCNCGASQRFEGYRPRRLITVLGPVEYRRAYYRCSACRSSHYAGEAALGLGDSSFTLPAQEMVALVCSELPFAVARQLLKRLSGLNVSSSHEQKLSQAHGKRLERMLELERRALFAGELSLVPQSRPDRLYVTLDGTMTRFVDDWHETKVGAVYDVTKGRDGMDEPDRTTYVGGVQEGVEGFGERLYQEAQRRGVDHARETVVVADGAPWIWNLAAEHFPDAIQILDYYHAVERLFEVGRAVYGENSVQGKEWAEANRGRLWNGDVDGLMRSVRGLRPSTEEGKEAVRLAVGYFRTNRQRMRYREYRARGLHIGSGVIEAACKSVVGARCKRSGMRWTKEGAQYILALRCLLLNDQWDEYWQPMKAAA